MSSENYYKDQVITSPVFQEKNLKKLRNYIVRFDIKHVDSYLDLGCGSGEVTSFIAALTGAKKVFGVEVSDASIERLSKQDITCRKADLNTEKIPYTDETFGLVTAFEFAEHLWNKDNFLKESFRVLKFGGYMILTTPNLLSFLSRLMVALGYLPMHLNLSFEYEVEKRPFQRESDLYGHISLYSPKTLEKHLKLVGFVPLVVAGLSLPYTDRSKILSWIDRIASRRSGLASDILIIAQKLRN